MIRIILFLLKLALLTAAAIWLAARPGQVTVNWLGYEITTTVGITLLALIALLALAIGAYSLWRALVGIPHSLSIGHLSRRQRKGYLALTQGLAAVAAGDAQVARRLAYRAEKYLGEPPLTLLLQAQAAQLAGDDNAAARYFNSMLDRPELSFLGLRGLITQALKRGDAGHALTLARRAQVLQPKADWVLTALVDLEARSQNWVPASEALAKAMRQGIIGPERGKRLRASILLAQAQQQEQTGFMEEAAEFARRAHEVHPGYVPAALIYARLLIRLERGKQAAKIIERCWRLSPHPELAALYMQSAGEQQSPLLLVKKAERLASYNPDAVDSRFAVARAALTAQLWGIAREQIEQALQKGPRADGFTLMAELAEKESADPAAAHQWLAKVSSAPPDKLWLCSDCQTPAPVWQPLCPHCGALGSIDWKSPAAAVPPGLPLLTNTPEKDSEIRAIGQIR